MPCLWPSFLVCSSFLKKVSSIIPHFPSFILGNANAMQYILKAIIPNVLAIFITLSLHFLWYLFGLIIPGKRCAMCLADRIKSATPSIGHKEVYLKRERGFFREFVSLSPREDKNITSEEETIQLPSVPETQPNPRQGRVIKVAGFSELSTSTHLNSSDWDGLSAPASWFPSLDTMRTPWCIPGSSSAMAGCTSGRCSAASQRLGGQPAAPTSPGDRSVYDSLKMALNEFRQQKWCEEHSKHMADFQRAGCWECRNQCSSCTGSRKVVGGWSSRARLSRWDE